MENEKKEEEEKEQEEEEKEQKEEISETQALIVVNDNKEINLNENNEEDKNYNDVNYWRIEIRDDIKNDILKELE